MYYWNETVQNMINWLENNLNCKTPLEKVSQYVGYSPCYCSSQFHKVTGKTIREYVTSRRISKVAVELRDTNNKIIDIALKYGFSSQEALTRAFLRYFNVTPNKYRKDPIPIALVFTKEVYKPYQHTALYGNTTNITKEIEIFTEVIEEHKYIGVWDIHCKNYSDFFNKYNCDEICGTIESLAHLTLPKQLTHTAGWYYEGNKKGYFYGIPVNKDYYGNIPKNMKCVRVPQLTYLVFYHPSYNYLKSNKAVMKKVEKVAFSFNVNSLNYQWHRLNFMYQKHLPEDYGYAVLRPISKI